MLKKNLIEKFTCTVQ